MFLRNSDAAPAGEGGNTTNTPGFDSLSPADQLRAYHPGLSNAGYYAEVAGAISPAELTERNGTGCDQGAFRSTMGAIKQALTTGATIAGQPISEDDSLTESAPGDD